MQRWIRVLKSVEEPVALRFARRVTTLPLDGYRPETIPAPLADMAPRATLQSPIKIPPKRWLGLLAIIPQASPDHGPPPGAPHPAGPIHGKAAVHLAALWLVCSIERQFRSTSQSSTPD